MTQWVKHKIIFKIFLSIKMSIIVLFLVLLPKLDYAFSQLNSFLNIEELNTLQYGIKIAEEPILFQENPDYNVLHISSKFGQLYSCLLPEEFPTTEKNDKITEVDPSTITAILDKSLNDTCQQFNKGWWTYKVCHKKNVSQFHISEDGKMVGEMLLGLFDSEDNWKDKDLSDLKTGELYHNINYINGSICDLTSKPRKTSVQYYCAEQYSDMIIRVEEPAACDYIITVHSKKLCTHPAFKVEEQFKKFELICYPMLKEKAYGKYQYKKEKESAEKERERREKERMAEEMKFAKSEEERLAQEKLKKEFDENKDESLESIMEMFNEPLKDLDSVVNTKDVNQELLKIDPSDVNIEEVSPGVNEEVNVDDKPAHLATKTEEYSINKEDLQKNVQDMIAKEIAETDSEADNLYEHANRMKDLLEKEFARAEEQTLKEIQKSKDRIKAMRKLLENTSDKEQIKQLSTVIKVTEDSLKRFTNNYQTLVERMKKVRRMEQETDKKLDKIEKELSQEKIVQAISKTFEEKSIKGKDKFIKDTVSKIFKKADKWKTQIKDIMSKVNKKPTETEAPNMQKERSESSGNGDNKTPDILKENGQSSDKEETVKTPTDDDKTTKLFNKLREEITKLNKKIEEDGDTTPEKQAGNAPQEEENIEEILEKEANVIKKENLKVRIRSLDNQELIKEIEQEMEGLDEDTKDNMKTATKQMEDAIKEQLKDAGIDLKDNIKIKVITKRSDFDNVNGKDLLSEKDAVQFKDFFLNFMGGGQEKKKEEKRQKSLEESYGKVWDEVEEEEKTTL